MCSYKHAVDGLIRVAREEGGARLFTGAAMATTRAVFMTIGQVASYDQLKQVLIASGVFADTPTTHFIASTMAVSGQRAHVPHLDVFTGGHSDHDHTTVGRDENTHDER
jgi:hypothetical protein